MALPLPLRRNFDYLTQGAPPPCGVRVKVPFGNQHLIGIVVGVSQSSSVDQAKQKFIEAVLDKDPLLPSELWQLIEKTARYYHHSLGDTFSTALPNALMKGVEAKLKPILFWQITQSGVAALPHLPARSVRLQHALRLLLTKTIVSEDELKANDISTATLNKLLAKGWVDCTESAPETPGLNTQHGLRQKPSQRTRLAHRQKRNYPENRKRLSFRRKA